MKSIRIYVKKKIELSRLNVRQKEMFKLGTVAVAAVKDRLAHARNSHDGAAKPLTKRYAIQKNRMLSRGGFRRTGRGSGRKNVRDLRLSGDMLRNFTVRTVRDNSVRAGVAGRSTIKTMHSKRGRLVGVPNRVKEIGRASCRERV